MRACSGPNREHGTADQPLELSLLPGGRRLLDLYFRYPDSAPVEAGPGTVQHSG